VAAFNLGLLLESQGDAEGAKAAYQRAIDSGHRDAAPMAAFDLGILLQAQGDAAGAQAAYHLAIDSGHADQAPLAGFSLGLLLEGQADVAGATAAYQYVIRSGHPQAAPMAMFNLGNVRRGEGDPEGAKAAYRQAIGTGDPDAVPMAMFNLGLLLQHEGDLDGAEAIYRQAIGTGHPDQAPKAAVNLGTLRRRPGPDHIQGETAVSIKRHALPGTPLMQRRAIELAARLRGGDGLDAHVSFERLARYPGCSSRSAASPAGPAPAEALTSAFPSSHRPPPRTAATPVPAPRHRRRTGRADYAADHGTHTACSPPTADHRAPDLTAKAPAFSPHPTMRQHDKG
jgi:tetratricopeptide (TPR) repeat protein